MRHRFLPSDRHQLYLLLPASPDLLAKNDLVWFLLLAVAQVDLNTMTQRYRNDGWGQVAYAPTMLLLLHA